MVLFINAGDSSRHTSSANTAIYPNLGLLTLMSSLKEKSSSKIDVGYIDGTVYSNEIIEEYIFSNINDIRIICFSVLTSNYGISVEIAKKVKVRNKNINVIFGNDHFSALYEIIMSRQIQIDYGFYGNDVVNGFTNFIIDLNSNKLKNLSSYSGLVYRFNDSIHKNEENSNEYSKLPFVKYNLVDSILPHQEMYFEGQKNTYNFIKENNLKSQVVDIGRGCVKFSGKRISDIPINACDFCGIIPGSKSVLMPSHIRAWQILKNAFDQGFNYFYITADELPLTMWNMLKSMSENIPQWYLELLPRERPKMFGYARAEGFVTDENKIDILINKLGFNHFFIGFDGLSEISLKVMNKQPVKKTDIDLMDFNVAALNKLGQSGCLITAGIVTTHLGITKEILDENYAMLVKFIKSYPFAFAALDFGPLCPIPGSQSFLYLKNPEFAQMKADFFGLNINREFLELNKNKYLNNDLFDMDDLVNDFIIGCCPDVNKELIEINMKKITRLATENNIVVGGGV
jgi:hypothetical protein